ncbi:hypothetical protein Hanom_Chr15g01373291 [Helianthus anomalus]
MSPRVRTRHGEVTAGRAGGGSGPRGESPPGGGGAPPPPPPPPKKNTRRFQKDLQTNISHFTRKSGAINDPTMAASWTDVEDIALCEAWEQAMIDPPPRGQGGLWVRVQQNFAELRGPEHNQTVDALSSRFCVLLLECERFD